MATVLSSPLQPRIIRRSQLRHAQPAAPSTNSNPPIPPEAAPALPPVSVREPAPVAPPASRVQIVDHPAAMHALTVLRDQQTPHYEFRTTSNQLLVLLAVEAMRSLTLRERRVETSAGSWNGGLLAKPVVFLSVTRDGLGLSHNLADCLPGLLVGGISIERTIESQVFQPRLHLASAPALSDARVILFDPVVSTGSTSGVALNLVRRLGANDISLVSFIVSSQGLLRLQADCPTLTVWTAGVDSDWDPTKRASTQALADFGTRLFS